MVHVYGQLGSEPYPKKDSLPFREGQAHALENIKLAAAGIKLYHEEANRASARARELLAGARRICLLGFCYHQFNVERLKIEVPFDLRTTVLGTARGLIGAEVQNAKNNLAAAIGGNIELIDADNLDLLRRYMFLG